jgi:DNA-binding transcriptional LysR family regulator
VAPRIVHQDRDAATLLAFARHGLAAAVLFSEALPPGEARRAPRLADRGRPFVGELYLRWRDETTLSVSARRLRDTMLDEARQIQS